MVHDGSGGALQTDAAADAFRAVRLIAQTCFHYFPHIPLRKNATRRTIARIKLVGARVKDASSAIRHGIEVAH
jgi:hypothetical protein